MRITPDGEVITVLGNNLKIMKIPECGSASIFMSSDEYGIEEFKYESLYKAIEGLVRLVITTQQPECRFVERQFRIEVQS